MEKNYYPLKISAGGPDDYKSIIISGALEWLGVGTVAKEIAQQLVDAYNEKYGCTDKKSACIGGRMCCQSKISHHAWMEQERYPLILVVSGEITSSRYKTIPAQDLLDDPNDHSEAGAVRAMDKLNLMLAKEPIVVVWNKKPNFIRRHIGNELLTKADVCIKSESTDNSAHSFTEGADLGRTNSADELLQERRPPRIIPSPEMQMEEARERGVLPDSIISTELVDVEKVITDLVKFVKDQGKNLGWPDSWTNTSEQIQNAEAALGMLQAFKEHRDKSKNNPLWNPDKLKQELDNMNPTKPRGHIGNPLIQTGDRYEVPLVDGRPQRITTKGGLQEEMTPQQVYDIMRNQPTILVEKESPELLVLREIRDLLKQQAS